MKNKKRKPFGTPPEAARAGSAIMLMDDNFIVLSKSGDPGKDGGFKAVTYDDDTLVIYGGYEDAVCDIGENEIVVRALFPEGHRTANEMPIKRNRKVMADEYRDARYLKLAGIAGAVMRLAQGEVMDQKDERDLACNLANLIRDDLGCYASVFLPTDVVGSRDEYEDMTIDEAKEVLSRMENYEHIRSSEWDALEDAAREVLSERKEGGLK